MNDPTVFWCSKCRKDHSGECPPAKAEGFSTEELGAIGKLTATNNKAFDRFVYPRTGFPTTAASMRVYDGPGVRWPYELSPDHPLVGFAPFGREVFTEAAVWMAKTPDAPYYFCRAIQAEMQDDAIASDMAQFRAWFPGWAFTLYDHQPSACAEGVVLTYIGWRRDAQA